MRQAREAPQALDDDLPRQSDEPTGRISGGGVLRVVRARQSRRLGQIEDLLGPAVKIVDQPTIDRIDATHGLERAGNGDDPARIILPEIAEDVAARRVVDADNDGGATALAVEDTTLGGDIAVPPAMAVEVIRADVQQHRHVAMEGEGGLELIGRQLEHIESLLVQPLQGQGRRADIAADRRRAAGLVQDVADQGGRGRLAVGAGDAENLGFGLGAGQKLDVAHHVAAGALHRNHGGVRLWMPVRDAGRENHQGHVAPVDPGGIAEANADGGGLAPGGLAVVPGQNLGTGGHHRLGAGQTGSPQPQHGDLMSVEEGKRYHRCARLPHLSFKVARPARARIEAMIQKRMTMVGSAQPFFSK